MSSSTGLRSLLFQTVVASTLMPGLFTFACLHSRADEQHTAPVTDNDDLSPEHVLEALRENSSSLSPISLVYTHEHIPAGDPAETLAELDIRRNDPRKFFFLSEQTLMWSEGRVYVSQTRPQVDGGVFSTYLWEESYTDDVHYFGGRFAPHPVLFRQPVTQEVGRLPNATVVNVPYLRTCGYDPLIWSDQQTDSLELRSWIPDTLDSGGTLEGVQLEQSGENSGLLRIDIIGPNPVRRQADSIDIEEAKRELEMSRETPERQRELIRQLEKRKLAPPTRNYTFWLDPKMHFAVRASEERDNEGQLLVERKCEEFEQIPERNVWIPRVCAVRHYSFETVPERIFQAPIVVEEIRVISIDPSPIEASRFVVDYTEHGARINDATVSGAANEPGGYRRYVVGAEENVVGAEKNEPRKVDHVKQPTNSSRPGLVGLNTIGLIVLVCFLGWWHWKRT